MEKPFPAYEGDDPYVFVCYSHADAEVVFPELLSLRERGVNLWYDEGIRPGTDWTDELAAALNNCSHLLFFVSPASAASENCRNEIAFARDRNKPIVAVYLEPTTLPPGLELAIGRQQALFKTDISDTDYWRKLLHALQAPIKHSDQPPVAILSSAAGVGPVSRRKRHSWVAAGLIMALVLLGGGFFWFFPRTSEVPEAAAVEAVDQISVSPQIAVIPFQNLDKDTEVAYLGQGVADDLRDSFVKVPGLFVVAETSSARFEGAEFDLQEIAAKLGVSHVVHGNVRKQDGRLRLSAELIDTRTNRLVWSDRFDVVANDLLTIENQIAQDILNALEIDTVVSKVDIDPEAYAAFLLGKHILFTDVEGARKQFERALEIEPKYADAHAYVAWTYIDQANFGMMTTTAAYPKAQASISRALTIDPLNVNAQVANQLINEAVNRAHQDVLNVLDEALHREPTNERILLIYSALLQALGLFQEMGNIVDHWISVDPLNATARRQRVRALIQMPGITDKDVLAEIEILESIAGRPDLNIRLEHALASKNNAVAGELLNTLAEARPGIRVWYLYLLSLVNNDPEAAQTYAKQIVESPGKPGLPQIRTWLTLGDTEKAFAIAEKELDDGQIQIMGLLRENVLENAEPTFSIKSYFAEQELNLLLKKGNADAESIAQLVVHPLRL